MTRLGSPICTAAKTSPSAVPLPAGPASQQPAHQQRATGAPTRAGGAAFHHLHASAAVCGSKQLAGRVGGTAASLAGDRPGAELELEGLSIYNVPDPSVAFLTRCR